MKAIDTNVLVRFLVRDDEKQAQIVYQAFKKAEMDKQTFFVPLLVVLETVWVLDSVYKLSRKEILDALYELLLLPVLKFESASTIHRFISLAGKNEIDLSDLLIACSAILSGCDRVLTFDKKASRFDFFEILETL
jgi:predicted nucleic-acid-binding protein